MEPPSLTPHVKTVVKIIEAKAKPEQERTRLEILLIDMIWAKSRGE